METGHRQGARISFWAKSNRKVVMAAAAIQAQRLVFSFISEYMYSSPSTSRVIIPFKLDPPWSLT